MANQQWVDFCGLLDIDGAEDSGRGAAARGLQAALAHYMDVRFGVTDVRILIDIIQAPAVIAAVVTALGNATTDAAAIKAAVAGVVAGA